MYTPRRSAVWLRSLYGKILRGSGLSFSEAITTQFCYTYALEGVTAMPRDLNLGSATHFSSVLVSSLSQNDS